MSKKVGLIIAGVLAALLVVLIVVGGAIIFTLRLTSEDDKSVSDQTSQVVDDGVAQQPTTPDPTNLLNSDYVDSYSIEDEAYGTVTEVVVDQVADTRSITSNALPNHDTGDFPNAGNPNAISEQDSSYTYPLTPTMASQPGEPRQPGVAVNGVKFEPGTAETASCDSGPTHRIEAIQEAVDLGLDFNNAHVQPTGAYHYHGASDVLADLYDNGQDMVHVGFAADGHLFYYSKSGAYKPSYELGTGSRGTGCADNRTGETFGGEKDGAFTSDWEYSEGLGDLDECNGITLNDQYVYVITDEYPYISRCLMGEFDGSGAAGGGAGPPPGSQG